MSIVAQNSTMTDSQAVFSAFSEEELLLFKEMDVEALLQGLEENPPPPSALCLPSPPASPPLEDLAFFDGLLHLPCSSPSSSPSPPPSPPLITPPFPSLVPLPDLDWSHEGNLDPLLLCPSAGFASAPPPLTFDAPPGSYINPLLVLHLGPVLAPAPPEPSVSTSAPVPHVEYHQDPGVTDMEVNPVALAELAAMCQPAQDAQSGGISTAGDGGVEENAEVPAVSEGDARGRKRKCTSEVEAPSTPRKAKKRTVLPTPSPSPHKEKRGKGRPRKECPSPKPLTSTAPAPRYSPFAHKVAEANLWKSSQTKSGWHNPGRSSVRDSWSRSDEEDH